MPPKMEDHGWMYTGRTPRGILTPEWVNKTEAFLDQAFRDTNKRIGAWCPCSKCGNKKRLKKDVMTLHLAMYGFTADYTRWTFHGEGYRLREEVVRPRVEDYDADGGVGDIVLERSTDATSATVATEPSHAATGDMAYNTSS